MSRISKQFSKLNNQSAFIAYICAGDPNYETSLEILKNMPKAGVDIIELGIPFLDPAGDGPTIQEASKRAISNGMTLKKTLQMVEEFRKTDDLTPIVLMGYYNPILKYGLDKIFIDAQKSGADAFLIVDLPLEEEQEISEELSKTNLDSIRLIAPTTDQERAKKIAKNAGGFLYQISMLGITGTEVAKTEENKENLAKLRKISDLPIAIGFGIQEPNQAQEFAKIGTDGVVVGSTIVKEIANNFAENKSKEEITLAVTKKLQEFANKIKN